MLEYRYIVPALLGMSSERTKCHYDVTSCSPSSEWKGRERKREGRGSGEGGREGKGREEKGNYAYSVSCTQCVSVYGTTLYVCAQNMLFFLQE